MSMVEGEKEQAEKNLAKEKSLIKDSDHQYHQLNEVVECAKRKLAISKKKMTELNVALRKSKHELAWVLPQLVAAPNVHLQS